MATPAVSLSLSQLAQLAEAARFSLEAVQETEALHAELWRARTRHRAADAALAAAILRENHLETDAAEEARCVAACAVRDAERAMHDALDALQYVEPRVHDAEKQLALALAPITGAASPCPLPCYLPRNSDGL
jgi:hypothetical protein